MAQQPSDINVITLSGGMVDNLSPSEMPTDSCELANNAEWFASSVGERRNGCETLDLHNSDSHLEDETHIVHISQWFPTNDVTNPEIWVVAATPGSSVTIARRKVDGTWEEVTPADAVLATEPGIYGINTQALNGKLFISYPSGVNRLHVWDGTSLRRTGLAQPGPIPSVTNEGAALDYVLPRYFRVRYAVVSGSTVLLRSEPTVSFAFTPSGTGAGATITKPATISEGETHWEIEASYDNANFYRIVRLVVGTTTYNDETTDTIGYAAVGTLSEPIGDYLLQPSARFLAVDDDRLLLASHWTDTALFSGVWWTPVSSDPGVGNDERLPLRINNFRSLDNYSGGALTGITSAINGSWFAFKWQRIYKMGRTGDVVNAYKPLTVTTRRGAMLGGIAEGMDENGAACIYFTDPRVGPSRLGGGGLQAITGLRETWKRVNLRASKVGVCGAYYPQKQQMKWWVAADGENSPNLGICIQVSELQPVDGGGVGRGLSLFTGRIAEAFCVAPLTERTTTDGLDVLNDRPFIGLTDPDFVQRTDSGVDDNGTDFVATIRSRAFFTAGLLNRFGAMTLALLATANPESSVIVRFIRDFGKETVQVAADLSPEDAEAFVMKSLDDLSISETTALQIELSDV